MSEPEACDGAVHVINHTHWDREWFLTEEYTTAWIPELIDALARLRTLNPRYQYLFDGQSLAIEDLLRAEPGYRETVTDLVTSGALGIGPQYSQPDWRMTSGELLSRNLTHGLADLHSHGGSTRVGWLVDTFGHISQGPQLMRQAGLDAAYVWRGVPQLSPVIRWRSPDGSEVTAINLFGGYRNLYGITRTPDLAVRRLTAEVAKLRPHYGELPIPLFDGYDLETEPEDPIRFYREAGSEIPSDIELVESSPQLYVDAVKRGVASAPTVTGELLSGKYGATFPGSLSSRTYLKVLHSDCEHWVHGVAEPLAAMASEVAERSYPHELFEQWDRELLQNAVHDCICGVSIDQVHERMERSYRAMAAEVQAEAHESIQCLAQRLQGGSYVAATSPVPTSGSVRVGAEVWTFRSDGFGLWPAEGTPIVVSEAAAIGGSFNSGAGPVRIDKDGAIHVADTTIGPLTVRTDSGDTYSSEPGPVIASLTAQEVVVESTSQLDTMLRIAGTATWDDGSVDATLRVRLSSSATVEISVDLDSSGTDFIVELEFQTGLKGVTEAGMPFDIVRRASHDADLLGSDLENGLDRVLMGQREVDKVESYPFHDHVAVSSESRTAVVHARGVRSYRSDGHGTIAIALRRSVEWLAKSGLNLRAGDAGPSMYVPGARCERLVQHQLGFSLLNCSARAPGAIEAYERFKHPVIPLTVSESHASEAELPWFNSDLPMSSLIERNEQAVGRFHNPTTKSAAVGDVRLSAGEIRQLALPPLASQPAPKPTPSVEVHWGLPFTDRAGRSRSVPNSQILAELDQRIEVLNGQLGELQRQLDSLDGDDYHRQLHRIYVVERESLELQLSAELNRRRLADPRAEVSIPDHADPAITQLGEHLNDLRIHRRIYDYVAEILNHSASV